MWHVSTLVRGRSRNRRKVGSIPAAPFIFYPSGRSPCQHQEERGLPRQAVRALQRQEEPALPRQAVRGLQRQEERGLPRQAIRALQRQEE